MSRRIRLISGVVLMAYVALHLINHALGLVSLEALAWGRGLFLALWRNPLGTVILYGALLAHMGLALWALYARLSLKLRPVDWLQVVLGFLLPLQLFVHILANRFAHEVYGLEDNYVHELIVLFVFEPDFAVAQTLLLVATWLHGCIGLHMWFRFKPWYRRWRGALFAVALVLPTLALAGYWVGGRDVLRLAADPAWVTATEAAVNAPNANQVADIYWLKNLLLAILAVAIILALALRPLKGWLRHRVGRVEVGYPNGKRVVIATGLTVLEASERGGIAHASVCGGRGRCSTCRIRIATGLAELPEASAAEQRVLERVKAAPNVRLACQLRPLSDLDVVPLLQPDSGVGKAFAGPSYLQGQEREIAVLFADLRGFTSLSEHKLPYDVVFVLNRYFASMGKAIEQSGGRIDKFIGDGVMALFGIEGGLAQGSQNALRAARAMGEELARLNENLVHDLEAPLRIGIGIHAGPVILGEMGYGASVSVTAIGDTVNTASRLESMTKEFEVQLIFSESVVQAAGIDCQTYPRREIDLRGRKGLLAVHLIEDSQTL